MNNNKIKIGNVELTRVVDYTIGYTSDYAEFRLATEDGTSAYAPVVDTLPLLRSFEERIAALEAKASLVN